MDGFCDLSSLITFSDVEICYSALIDVLAYRDSPNFFENSESNDFYDAEYAVTVNDERYSLVGIKKLSFTSESEITKLHLQYWNKNDIPFSILILPHEIRIYNNFTIKTNNLLYSTSRDQNIYDISDFCNDTLISNLTNKKFEKCFKRAERVDQRLLENLRVTIQLLNKKGMNIKPAYNFLAQCIFVKYLEDREIIDLSSSVFIDVSSQNFTELLELRDFNVMSRLFEILKGKFQGDFFDLSMQISSDQLEVVGRFFGGEDLYINGGGQISLFAYDFSIIPIELISNIYETFFVLDDQINKTEKTKRDGAYYTPCYLAEFIVSSLFEQTGKSQPTVLDPACGSGVFLVSCYKRMVDIHLQKNKKISATELKNILENHIYGIDKNEEALKIACFSLYVAMLDYLMPKDIYENQVQLPTLKQNLIAHNFLDPIPVPELSGVTVDFIIGNPPWVSADEDVIEKRIARSIGVSDKQTAQLFILYSRKYACANTWISFLVPNSIFLNQNASTFREQLFELFTVREVMNLHWMKQTLFKNAKAPCSILTLQATPSQRDYAFSYCAFRPNLLSTVLNQIVYDEENIIRLKKSEVQHNEYVWYTLTSGDQFDLQTILYMQEYPRLRDQMTLYKLECGRGFAVGKGNEYCPEFLEYRGGNLDGCFESYFINARRLPAITQAYYERPRKLSFYQFTNKLLVKRTYNKRTGHASSSQDIFIFSDDFHQLADTTGENLDLIFYLEALYNSRVFDYYCFHCTKVFVSIKPEISKDNLLDFPVPPFSAEDDTIQEIISNVRRLKQLKEHSMHAVEPLFSLEHNLQGEIDEIQRHIDQQIFHLYGFSDIEQEVVNDTLNLISGSPVEATSEDLRGYQELLCTILNNVFSGSDYMVNANLIHSKRFFTIALFDVKRSCVDDVNLSETEVLKKLVDLLGASSLDQLDGSIIVKKRISGFTPNGFYFIKLKDRQNWSKMSAIRDASFVMQTAISEHQKEEFI